MHVHTPAAQLSLVRIEALSSSFCCAVDGWGGRGRGGWEGEGSKAREGIQNQGKRQRKSGPGAAKMGLW